MSKPFRFGLQAYAPASGKDWRDLARKAENMGFSSFHLADHVIGPGPALSATGHPVQTVAAIPAMAVAAEATNTIKIGCRVLCVDYRNPVMLAKEVATLDFYKDLVAFAKKHDIFILSDLAYAEVFFDDDPPPSVLQVPGAIDITVSGFCPSSSVVLDIDGTTVGGGTTDGSGSATITITAPTTAGTYTVTATASGECSDVASLAIVVTAGGGLPSTGSNSTMPGLQIAIVAVLVGGALVGLASMRRRRSAAH